MDCPICKKAMAILEIEEIEVDYCFECGGVWLDAGELELLFGDAAACHAFMIGGDIKAAGDEKKRPCPRCRAKMDKAVTGGASPIVYDRCPHEHGLWFDHGELDAVLQEAHALGHAEVSGFLKEVFSNEDGPAGA